MSRKGGGHAGAPAAGTEDETLVGGALGSSESKKRQVAGSPVPAASGEGEDYSPTWATHISSDRRQSANTRHLSVMLLCAFMESGRR